MASRHVVIGNVAFALAAVPMQSLPIVAKHFAHRVSSRQSDSNAVVAFSCGDTLVNQIVLMAIIHVTGFQIAGRQYNESLALFATICGALAISPTENAPRNEVVHGFDRLLPNRRRHTGMVQNAAFARA